MEKEKHYRPVRQVLPLNEEFEVHQGYSADPLEEQDNAIPGLLHKYKNRADDGKGGLRHQLPLLLRRHFLIKTTGL